jgi:hypothetical protein
MLHTTYIQPHEDIVFLLVANSEFALRLLVVVGEVFELARRVVLHDCVAELDVALCVFVTGLEMEDVVLAAQGFMVGEGQAYVDLGVIR